MTSELLRRIRRGIASHGAHGEDAINAFEALEAELSKPTPSSTGKIAPPTEQEIAAYRDLFRAELDKRMDTEHPSASPSTEAHEVALRRFVEMRNRSIPSSTGCGCAVERGRYVCECKPNCSRALDLLTEVRIRAEGSDWKRDSGETLIEWLRRRLSVPSHEGQDTAAQLEAIFDEHYCDEWNGGSSYTSANSLREAIRKAYELAKSPSATREGTDK